MAHLQDAARNFGEELQEKLARVAATLLLPSTPLDKAMRIPAGQPYRLRLLQAIAVQCSDPDADLLPLLEEGVPAGIFSTLPSSMQWQHRQESLSDTSMSDIQLQQCAGNCSQAEQDPDLLKALLAKEIQAGHVVSFEGDRKSAANHWPQGIAIGKLNIVIAVGRDPRLVLDSAVCKANALRRIPEHVALPSAHEVMRSFQHGDAYREWIALALDFKAARKTVKVKPSEQGALLVQVDQQLYCYTVCHFGAKFSAYWWSRLGALLTRAAHALLSGNPRRMWLYVDDPLTLLKGMATPSQPAFYLPSCRV